MIERTSDVSFINFHFFFAPLNIFSKVQEIVLKVFKQIADVFSVALDRLREKVQIISTLGFSNTLVNFSREERANIIAHALQLITNGMSLDEKRGILKAIVNIHRRERDDVIAHALQLITNGMSLDEKRGILKAIVNIHRRERDDVINHARQLITNGMSGYEKRGILKATADIPREERDDVIDHAQQLITDDMTGFEKRFILKAIADIPRGERDDVIDHAQQLITPQMHGYDIQMLIENIADIPREDGAAFVENRRRGQVLMQQAPRGVFQLAQRQGINVHENKRDQRVKDAFLRLKEIQKNVSEEEIQEASSAFITYLGALEDSEKKRSALFSLLSPKNDGEYFGPLIDGVYFSINGLGLTGEEVVGRLWIFTSKLEEKEQENAKASMVSALAKSYEDHERVCNGGKTQRLVVGVLQGRLEGVQIDNDQITTADVVREFFAVEAHKGIEDFTELLQAATAFLQERPMVNQIEFLKEVKEIAILNGIVTESEAEEILRNFR